jgi:hypothetical protein
MKHYLLKHILFSTSLTIQVPLISYLEGLINTLLPGSSSIALLFCFLVLSCGYHGTSDISDGGFFSSWCMCV